jgi:hypothetical protein
MAVSQVEEPGEPICGAAVGLEPSPWLDPLHLLGLTGYFEQEPSVIPEELAFELEQKLGR